MNSIEKKLDALIDELGFNVECDLDRQSYHQANALKEQQTGSCVPVNMSDHYKHKLTKRQPKQTQQELIIECAQELYRLSIKAGCLMHTIKYNNLTLEYHPQSGTMEVTTDEKEN